MIKIETYAVESRYWCGGIGTSLIKIAGHVHFEVFDDELGRDSNALEDVHLGCGWIPMNWIFLDDEYENIVVQRLIIWYFASESCRFVNQRQWEPFYNFSILVIQNGDPDAVESQGHLLSPDSGSLLHLKEAAHSVRWIHHLILSRYSKCRQMFHYETRAVPTPAVTPAT